MLKIGVVGLLIALVAYPALAMAAPGPGSKDWGTAQEVDSYKTQAQLKAGEPQTFRFRQRTQLSFNCNVQCEVNLEVDAPSIGDGEFAMQIEGATTPLKLELKANASDDDVGMKKGNQVQAKNQNRYRYQYSFMFNASANATFTRARLYYNVGEDTQAKWAYYNETSKEWETLPTTVENGYAVAETTHFSVYTILTPDTEGDIGTPAMWIGFVGGIGLAFAVIIRKRRHR